MAGSDTHTMLTDEDIKAIVREVSRHISREERYLDKARAFEYFSFKPAFIDTLVRDGRVVPYPVKGHPKKVCYKYSELEAVFVTYQSADHHGSKKG